MAVDFSVFSQAEREAYEDESRQRTGEDATAWQARAKALEARYEGIAATRAAEAGQ